MLVVVIVVGGVGVVAINSIITTSGPASHFVDSENVRVFSCYM